MAKSRVLRVLFLKEGTGQGWVAQGLEFDLAAQGDSIGEAVQNFQEVFEAQVALDKHKGQEPLAGKKEAPSWYWRALEEAKPLRDPIVLQLPRYAWLSFFGFRTTSAQAWVR